MLRRLTFAMMAAVVCLSGCGALKIVANPDYEAWAGFGVGSYVTFEGTEIVGRGEQKQRVTEKLVSLNEQEAELELTVTYIDDEGNESEPGVVKRRVPAEIFATQDPSTHPDSDVDVVGTEVIEVGGEALECTVIEVNLDTQFLMLGQKLNARICANDKIPGGKVKVTQATITPDRYYQSDRQVVEWESVVGEE